jgi:hypothetical protein
LMMGLDTALAKNAWITATCPRWRIVGGYMVNWIAGHTNQFKGARVARRPVQSTRTWPPRRRNLAPDWSTADPLESEGDGDAVPVYSPHLYVKNFKTPTLVTGGEPTTGSHILKTSRCSRRCSAERSQSPVMFPDEGHWIGKPQNQRSGGARCRAGAKVSEASRKRNGDGGRGMGESKLRHSPPHPICIPSPSTAHSRSRPVPTKAEDTMLVTAGGPQRGSGISIPPNDSVRVRSD